MRFTIKHMRSDPDEIFDKEHSPSFHEGRSTEECNELQEGIDWFVRIFAIIVILSVDGTQIPRASILLFCSQTNRVTYVHHNAYLLV